MLLTNFVFMIILLSSFLTLRTLPELAVSLREEGEVLYRRRLADLTLVRYALSEAACIWDFSPMGSGTGVNDQRQPSRVTAPQSPLTNQQVLSLPANPAPLCLTVPHARVCGMVKDLGSMQSR